MRDQHACAAEGRVAFDGNRRPVEAHLLHFAGANRKLTQLALGVELASGVRDQRPDDVHSERPGRNIVDDRHAVGVDLRALPQRGHPCPEFRRTD